MAKSAATLARELLEGDAGAMEELRITNSLRKHTTTWQSKSYMRIS